MKISIISDIEVKKTYRTVTAKFDEYIIHESYENDVLTNQFLTTENPKKSHPTAYEATRMRFYYYENIDFLNSEENCNHMSFYDLIPKSTIIKDWDKFNKIDNILCEYLGMDGCIYRINQKDPVPLWRSRDYIGGFCNDKYNLDKVVDILKNKSWARNVKIEKIPYYNQDEGRTKYVSFDYKLPSKKYLKKELGELEIFKDHYWG